MKSRTPKHGTQDQRSAAARAKLLDATIELVAEHGAHGFSLADVGERAGVSRGLAVHHFHTREELLDEATARLVRSKAWPEAGDAGGLPDLMAWFGEQLARASDGAVDQRALLQLLSLPSSPRSGLLLETHVAELVTLVQRHLEQARALAQVRSEPEPEATAPLLIAQLHGELMRVARGGPPNAELFTDLVVRSLAPPPLGERRPRKASNPPPATGGTQGALF